MPLSEVEYKRLLIRSTGNHEKVAEEMDLLWRRRDNYSDLELRFSYCCLDAFELIMGFTWQEYNLRTSAGEVVNASDRFDHLVRMAMLAQQYIDSRLNPAMGDTDGGGGPQVDQMTARAPLESPSGYLPDLNDSLYQGDPQALFRRRWNA